MSPREMAVEPDINLARGMFDALRANTSAGRGITRATYGAGENFAHDLARKTAEDLGLEIATDPALNLYMTLPGRQRELPRLMTGSHMDSVPQGGNYDGAAGVVAGLAALAGLCRQGVVPERDITVMAIRAEEAAWFNSNYIGSHAAFGLGFVVGPAIGGYLGNHNLRFPFWAAAALSLANAVYGYFVLPESLPPDRRAKSAWHMANPLGALALLRSHPVLAGLSVVVTLYYLAHNSLPSIWALYTEYRYAWSHSDVGNSLALVGVCAALVSGVLVGPIVKRFGERRCLLCGLFFGILGFSGFALANRGWIILVVIPLIALWGIAAPAMQSLMSRHVDPSSQGRLQGAINSLRALTGMAGPILFSQIFAVAISPKFGVHLPGTPYLVAAGFLLASLLLALYVTRGNVTSSAAEATSPAVDT